MVHRSSLKYLAALTIWLFALPALATEKVSLRLSWHHNFTNAGFYAAQWQGYYDDAGLEVEIKPGFAPNGKRIRPENDIMQGGSHFGVVAPVVIFQKGISNSLTLIAPLFQRSPVALYALAGTEMNSPADLTRLRVGTTLGGSTHAELLSMLLGEGIDPQTVNLIPIRGSRLNALIDVRVDVVAHYSTSLPWQANSKDISLETLRPSAFGIEFYGLSLVTSRRLSEKNPELVQRFKEASLKGWNYALEHSEETVQRIAKEYPGTRSKGEALEYNRFLATEVRRLMLFPIIPVGNINRDRIQSMHWKLKSLKMAQGDLDIDRFIHDIKRDQEHRFDAYIKYLIVALLAVVSLLIMFSLWSLFLKRKVEIATRSFQEAKEYAETANRARSAFLANMSHELRTPLNAVIGFSELMMKESFGPIGNEKYADYINDINASGHHLLDHINEMLDLSKIEARKVDIQEQTFNPLEVIQSCMNMVNGQAGSQGIQLATDIKDQIPLLRADERMLKQILFNLLSNAVKFTHEGGNVTLKAWSRLGSGHVFQVIDTGIGVALDDIPKILRPFTQIENVLTRKYQGTGLGLTLVKHLVELHGGYLDFQSELGVGSTVTVRFPKERIVVQEFEATSLPAA